MHQSKGHSSSLVLTIRKSHQSGPDNPAPPSVQSHGLHTIPSPVASNNAACPRWKIANQDGESTTCAAMHEHSIIEGEIYCGEWPNSARSRIRPRWRPTSVLQSRLPPSSPPPSHHCGVLNLWHRATFIHHGSAIFIAGDAAFFEASADCDGLECDVAWLVTALQRVVSDLVVKPI
ncbi:unnamed protein product [Penicillium nalgiovense]|nr:unnamed protein product [Penicillium nalgiovense]